MPKRAIVTGASSGIGRELVVRLAAGGWTTLAVARRRQALDDLRSTAPERILVHAADLADAASPAAIVDDAVARLGGLDLLVNNAGVCWAGEFRHMPLPMIDELLAVNVRGLVLMCRAAAEALARGGGGQIINVASIVAHVPQPYVSVYCGSKAAVLGFSRALARELAPLNIRVNTVSPDGTNTEIFAKMGSPVDPSGFIPAGDMAAMIVSLTGLPPSVDVGDLIVEQRLAPKR